MAIFINTTESIGIILAGGTQTLTGSIIATLFLVLAFIFVLCIMFNIPLEFSAVLIFPLIISMAAFYSQFLILVVGFGIYFSIIIAKNFIFR